MSEILGTLKDYSEKSVTEECKVHIIYLGVLDHRPIGVTINSYLQLIVNNKCFFCRMRFNASTFPTSKQTTLKNHTHKIHTITI